MKNYKVFPMSVSEPEDSRHLGFRVFWLTLNFFLLAAIVSSIYNGTQEFALRRYLSGFADAVVPAGATPEQKTEAILFWMRAGPARRPMVDPSELSSRDPVETLNYQQLLEVCGTATNAFLNLARSSGLGARRLLLLAPDGKAKHVVAEVLVRDRWVVVDPAYRIMFRNAQGRSLTSSELKDPSVLAEAVSAIPGYPMEYNYDRFAHVRLARLPLDGMGLRWPLSHIYPAWDEAADWSLVVERKSLFYLVVSVCLAVSLLLVRVLLGWYADRRLKAPRFHLREQIIRATASFFSPPEIRR